VKRILFCAALLAFGLATIPLTPTVDGPAVSLVYADGAASDPPFQNGVGDTGTTVPMPDSGGTINQPSSSSAQSGLVLQTPTLWEIVLSSFLSLVS